VGAGIAAARGHCESVADAGQDVGFVLADGVDVARPFLVFAAAAHPVSSRLVGRSYVADRTGPRTRLPVFDGPVLAAFATEPAHRLFIAELLASYARVASGVVWRRESRGWRRQRWNELDLPPARRAARDRGYRHHAPTVTAKPSGSCSAPAAS
jgi:hypothetical protein